MNLACKIINVITDIFYPKRCISCGCFINYGQKTAVCDKCIDSLEKVGRVERDNSKNFTEAVAVLPYEGCVKEIFTDFKFRNMPYLAESYAYVMYHKIKDRDFIKDIDLICPVPIHVFRDREYNQSDLIARALSRYLSIECVSDVLIKGTNINKLSKLKSRKRRLAVRSVFEMNIFRDIEGKNILLIDDVYTTGSTTNECAGVLKRYGADKVYVLSACYAIQKVKGEKNNADANNSYK